MKNLRHKIFAGAVVLASFGIFAEKNLMAQNADSLEIKIDTLDFGEPFQQIITEGNFNKKLVVYFGCSDYKENHYNIRHIHWGNSSNLHERFEIKYDFGLINYEMYFTNPYQKIVQFEDLTKEQIFQDKEFAERTKRIINACESEENLREVVKEIYKERKSIHIPEIKK